MGLRSLLLVGILPLLISARPNDGCPAAGPTTPTSASSGLPTQPGLASNCNKFHLVVSGDTCNAVEAAAGVSAADFMAWNPAINTACTNMWLDYYVCIGVSGSDTTPTPSTPTGLPTQSGLASNCNKFHLVVSGDTCNAVEAAAGVSAADFMAWNPAINTACTNMWLGYYVCIGVSGSATTPTPSTPTTAPTGLPTQSGLASNCNKFHLVVSGDTCNAVEAAAGVSAADFMAWNPAINSACTNMWLGYYVCIGVSGSGAATVPFVKPIVAAAASLPTQPGVVANCNKFHLVVSGDTCNAVEAAAGISSAQFLMWNPSIDAACDNMWLGYNVCIGVPDVTAFIPSPTMPGVVGNCQKYYLVASGDTCIAVESKYGISQAQIMQWNTNVHSNCDNLWLGYYMCVGA